MPSLLGLNFHRKKTVTNGSGTGNFEEKGGASNGEGSSGQRVGEVNEHIRNLDFIDGEKRERKGGMKIESKVESTRSPTGITAITATTAGVGSVQHHGPKSFNELTRFFRPNMKKKVSGSSMSSSTKLSDLMSPEYSDRHHEHRSHTLSAIPPSTDSTLSLSNKANIYHDDSILAQKYGKLGKVIGSGAGGSVKVLIRPSDGSMFAVKQFRARKPNESTREYARKCTSEYCVGSMLHHPNIIETLDIFSDARQTQYYEVMEYCPVDFFAVVMSGEMSRPEINCCLKQLTNAVQYLHSKGYAHRDLKLDNCVMTKDGILKLIDFGSAFVFKYTYEIDTKLARGIVGSDPYLAPEVLTCSHSYDAPKVDIWSLGIIFCCMMLKRFPWKVPRDSDANFRLYCEPDNMQHDYVKSAKEHETLMKQKREERQRLKKAKEQEEITEGSSSQRGTCDQITSELGPNASTKIDVTESETHENISHPTEPNHPDAKHDPTSSEYQIPQPKPKKIIHGPYRLLRLLPHASRPIMSKILAVDPEQRATMEEIYADEWFSQIPFCSIDDKGNVIRAPGHSHTIVTEENAHLEKYKI